jgi:hypothetical protein
MAGRPREESLSDNSNALNALDLIINVLKNHEKELDKLVNELKGLVQKLSLLEKLASKVESLDEKLSSIESAAKPMGPAKPAAVEAERPTPPQGPPATLRFRSWEEFKDMASGCEAISYIVREEDEEQVLEVEALKGRMLLTYIGPLPGTLSLIKSWLSGELEVPKANVFEGSIKMMGR